MLLSMNCQTTVVSRIGKTVPSDLVHSRFNYVCFWRPELS